MEAPTEETPETQNNPPESSITGFQGLGNVLGSWNPEKRILEAPRECKNHEPTLSKTNSNFQDR